MPHNNNEALIKGLIQFASWLDSNPDFPELYTPHFTVSATQYGEYDEESGNYPIDVDKTTEKLGELIKQLPRPVEKKYGEYNFTATHIFGDPKQKYNSIKLEVSASRQVVCKKVVVGTKIIPAQPEREEEIVEYDCEKIAFTAIAPAPKED